MIRRLLVISLALSAPALVVGVACSKGSCEDTGSCGEYDGPLPWCDGVFRNNDGTVCDSCPARGDDGIWRAHDAPLVGETEDTDVCPVG